MLHAIHLTSFNSPLGLTSELQRLDVLVTEISAEQSIQEICQDLNALMLKDPILFIATGENCLDLPFISSAQRAAHRSVISYALIDPDYPVSTDAWPNAPVFAYLHGQRNTKENSKIISLRGIEVQQFGSVKELAILIEQQVASAQ